MLLAAEQKHESKQNVNTHFKFIGHVVECFHASIHSLDKVHHLLVKCSSLPCIQGKLKEMMGAGVILLAGASLFAFVLQFHFCVTVSVEHPAGFASQNH